MPITQYIALQSIAISCAHEPTAKLAKYVLATWRHYRPLLDEITEHYRNRWSQIAA